MKILAQRPTHISAVATVLLITKTFTERERERQTDRQRDRETERERQTDRQTDREGEREKEGDTGNKQQRTNEELTPLEESCETLERKL